MSGVGLELIIIFVLILANGLFSMLETALVSSRKARLQQRVDEGDPGARAALDLIEVPNSFLSTLQVGITLIGILSGAVGGATLSDNLTGWLSQFEPIRPYAQAISLTLVVLIITYFSLVLGELVPKRLALNSPERTATLFSRPLKVFSRLVTPIVRLLSVSTDFVLKTLGMRPSNEPVISEEEIRVLLEQGAEVGIFEEAEQDMVESVFRLSGRRVDALMVPRPEIVWLNINDPLEEILARVLESHHSRFPVVDENLDDVIGILLSKDLLANRLVGPDVDVRALLRLPLFVPESTPAMNVLSEFKNTGAQLALVIDEYGGLQGMVTLYDVLEAIIGDIHVLGQANSPGAVRREDGSWLFDGMLQIDEFKELLDLDELPGEDRAGYQTVGGFVMSQLGVIPNPGEHFEWKNLRFEVVDMDGRRVDKILVITTS
jgi:putative hemolysin